MLAVRYHQRNGIVHVRRLHPSVTLTYAQRAIDAAIDTAGVVKLWGADDQLIEFSPQDCNDVQVLDLQRG